MTHSEHEKANYVLWVLIDYVTQRLLAAVEVGLNSKLLKSFLKSRHAIHPLENKTFKCLLSKINHCSTRDIV